MGNPEPLVLHHLFQAAPRVRIEAAGKEGVEIMALNSKHCAQNRHPVPTISNPREKGGTCSQTYAERQLSETASCIVDAMETPPCGLLRSISYAGSLAGDPTLSNHRAQRATHFEDWKIA